MFTARVVVPTPPFGLKKATISALPERDWRVRLDLARADELRHHAALELAVGEAADDHVVRPGLEEGDLRLDVVGRRDDEDRRDPIGAGSAQRGNRTGGGEALGNDQVELASAHGGDGIGRRANRGGRVSDVGEGGFELGAQGGLARADEDRVRGHGLLAAN